LARQEDIAALWVYGSGVAWRPGKESGFHAVIAARGFKERVNPVKVLEPPAVNNDFI